MTDLCIGLLVCDHVRPDFRDIAGDYTDMFESLLGDGVTLRRYSLVDGEFPVSVTECDGWITTGSGRSVYDDVPWIKRFAELTREIVAAGVPLVGVCFGHQMIAHALGGKVENAGSGWGVGVKSVTVLEPQPWMGAGVSSYRILNSHHDQVTGLPPGASVIGSNDHCQVAAFTLGDRVVGIQGHPEFVPDYAKALMEHRRGWLIPDEVVDEGIASLAEPPDRELLASWIAQFFESTR